MCLWVAESSDGEVGAVRPLQKKKVLTMTLDAEVLASGVRTGGHGVGARQKFKNRWINTLGVRSRLHLAFEHCSVDTHTVHLTQRCLMHMVAFFSIRSHFGSRVISVQVTIVAVSAHVFHRFFVGFLFLVSTHFCFGLIRRRRTMSIMTFLQVGST